MKHVQNHEIIGITKVQFEALDEVRARLLAGDIAAELFDMERITLEKGCGTAHCIAGWARTVSSPGSFPYEVLNYDHPLRTLFCPQVACGWRASPKQAAAAIENFLRQSPGEPRWTSVMFERSV